MLCLGPYDQCHSVWFLQVEGVGVEEEGEGVGAKHPCQEERVEVAGSLECLVSASLEEKVEVEAELWSLVEQD